MRSKASSTQIEPNFPRLERVGVPPYIVKCAGNLCDIQQTSRAQRCIQARAFFRRRRSTYVICAVL